ncbi:MAG: N-acetyl-gamma-glutamyl-phosphate reductase [Bacteroidales bacterium]|nr:N-acetyl-gamma-glutamyl-phosphate reductase [Bacteroidales bacterium]MDY6443804.1 N-acetyl-gamma-glutamyl-phosphate reductase [Bacteroidales bacterium]
MIKVGIIGGAGYTAGELLRILVNHPEVEIVFVHSTSNAGNHLYDVHGGLFGDTELTFSDSYDLEAVDVLFLCSAHGKSREFWEQNACPEGLKVVDLAQDYRDESEGYVYGLPEWQRDKIRTARKIANPGCFATAIQLALLPLAHAGLLQSTVHVTAITGSTGAGVKPAATTHFSWRTDNLSTYKVFEHQHLKEICRNLGILSSHSGLDPESLPQIQFVPMRGDFARGIFASVTVDTPLSGEEALALYQKYYADAAFTFVSDRPVDLKQVVNTNKAIVAPEVHDGTLVVSSVIDNLLKGASGQAVQNMNLIFGIPETTGLKLKASAF